MKKFIAVLLSVLMLLSIVPVAFAEDAVKEDNNTEESLNAGDLFGGFFVKIGEMLQIVFDFLANLFSGTGGNASLGKL